MSSGQSIQQRQNALRKTIKGTAPAPYGRTEGAIASFFGLPVDYTSMKAREESDVPASASSSQDVLTLEPEPKPEPDASFISTLRKKVHGIFSKKDNTPPVTIATKPSNNLNYYGINRNNSVSTGLVKAAMTPANVRANAMRRATERLHNSLKPKNNLLAIASRKTRTRRSRKSKVNTRKRR